MLTVIAGDEGLNPTKYLTSTKVLLMHPDFESDQHNLFIVVLHIAWGFCGMGNDDDTINDVNCKATS